jgi:ribosomal protein S8
MTDAICRHFRVKHRDMVYLKFILEAYEGMNTMSTVDNAAGIIRIAVMPGFVEDMDALLAELGGNVTMEPVSQWGGEQ